MDKKLIELLNLSTETEIVEFKEAKTQYDTNKLGKYFSALSNEANLKKIDYAWIVFGVKDNKDIVGTSISDKQINNYKSEMANHTTLNLSFIDVCRVSKENKNVLMFQIPAAPKGVPIAWKGHYYGRNGESLGALNLEEIERIRKQAVSEDWSAKIINKASIDDLSEEAIERARKSFLVKNPKLKENINSWDNKTFLNKAKITIKGKITNTAILLLGKSESEHLLSPAVATISWILKDRDNVAKDYEHFSCPFLLEVENVFAKIRNLKYRYLQAGTLFPDEVDQYDPYVIREAINNCIAHQDYSLGGKINVVEREDGKLIFSNKGTFIPKSIENVLKSDAPESIYRNKFLAQAMVNLNMIDTIGSGIVKMFNIQRDKYFPLPEYLFEDNSVQLTIEGKILDVNYASKLATVPDLSLWEIVLLDKVQKGHLLTVDEVKTLKKKKLIEGRKPNFHISSNIAKATGEKENYIKQRGFKDEHYKKLILEYIDKYGSINKESINKLILDLLPNILTQKQKLNKVKNIVYGMSSKDKSIKNIGTTRKAAWIRN
jgi:ATP-dependent DNA helicase RecG